MQCLYCHARNVTESGACRTCGAPLRARVSARDSQPCEMVRPPRHLVADAPRRANSAEFAHWKCEGDSPFVSLGFWPDADDGAWLIGALEDGALAWWHPTSHREGIWNPRFWRRPEPTTCAAFLPAHNLVATGHADGSVRLLELFGPPDGAWEIRCRSVANSHFGAVRALEVAPDALFSVGRDGAVVSVSLTNVHASTANSQVVLEGRSSLLSFGCSPDGELWALGGDDGSLEVWNVSDKTPRHEWRSVKHKAPVELIAFAPNGNLLISCDADARCTLRVARSGYELPLPSLGATQVAFAPNSRLIALADASGQIELCDAWAGLRLESITSRVQNPRQLAFWTMDKSGLLCLAALGAQEVVVWRGV